MRDCFEKEGMDKIKAKIKSMGINCSIEIEEIERYPYVLENINKRGVKLKS